MEADPFAPILAWLKRCVENPERHWSERGHFAMSPADAKAIVERLEALENSAQANRESADQALMQCGFLEIQNTYLKRAVAALEKLLRIKMEGTGE